MPNKLFDYADPEHPMLRGGGFDPESGMSLGGDVGAYAGNAYDALMGYVRRVMATDPVAVQQALRDQAAAERQRSVDMGYADPVTGLPTAKGAADIAGQWGRGVMLGTTAPGEAPGITVYHGSPHSFDRFDIGKIGTGEGAQAYGHGLYFAENEGVARSYRDALTRERGPQSYWTDANGNKLDVDALRGGSGPQSEAASMLHQRGSVDEAIADVKSYGPDAFSGGQPQMDRTLTQLQKWKDAGLTKQTDRGSMYEVNIASDPEHFLHWDKPLSEQSPYVQDAVADLAAKLGVKMGNATGARAHADLADALYTGSRAEGDGWTTVTPTRYGDPAAAAQALREAGIPGIRYYDQGSRAAGEGTHNYVVFSPDTLEILRKYGIAGLGITGAAGASNALDQSSESAP